MCISHYYIEKKNLSSRIEQKSVETHTQELQHSMRLFRAQRNFYIAGFSIFLTLVIRRLVILISTQAQLLAQSEASLRQAQSATTAARSLLSQQKVDDQKDEDKKLDDEDSGNLVSSIYSHLFIHNFTKIISNE